MTEKLTRAEKRHARQTAAREAFDAAVKTFVDMPAPENARGIIAFHYAASRLVGVSKSEDLKLNVEDAHLIAGALAWLEASKSLVAAAEVELAVTGLPAKLEEAIVQHKKTVAKLAADLSQNPLSALSWSRDAFEAAAKIEVAATVIRWMENGVPTEATPAEKAQAMHSEALKEVTRRVRSVTSRSTSPTSNLADDYLLSAWGDMASSLSLLSRGHFGWEF